MFTVYMVHFFQGFGHWQAILFRLKRIEKKKKIKPAVIFQHVCICRDMLGLTNLVLRMWKLSVRLFSKQPGRSRIIIQLIVSFFLKCSKTAGQTTPPPAQKKRNQVDTGIVRSVFQGRRWVEFVLVLHRHSYTTNLPKSACRCPQEGGGWSEGREGLDSSNSLSQAEMH